MSSVLLKGIAKKNADLNGAITNGYLEHTDYCEHLTTCSQF